MQVSKKSFSFRSSTKPNSTTPNQTHPYHTKLYQTKPSQTIPNQILPTQTGWVCITESYPGFANHLQSYSLLLEFYKRVTHSLTFVIRGIVEQSTAIQKFFIVPLLSIMSQRQKNSSLH